MYSTWKMCASQSCWCSLQTYGQPSCHGVENTFDTAVITRRVGACQKFVYTENKGVHPSYVGVRCKPWLVFLPL